MKFRSKRHQEGGFTLIELLIVIAIIAILAAILVPNFLRARRQALISATKANLHNIGTVLEEYYVDNQGYPVDPNDLVPTYTSRIPARPDGNDYDYATDGNTPAQNYVLCDNTTDTITSPGQITTWYWLPPAGLFFALGASVDVGFATCP